MKKLIAVCACVLCLTGCGSSQKSEKPGGNTAGNSAQSVAKSAKPMKFSSDDEFREYAEKLWVKESSGKNGNGVESTYLNMVFFTDEKEFVRDFSYPKDQKLEEALRPVIKYNEEHYAKSFHDSIEFFAVMTTGEGVVAGNPEIEFDRENAQIKSGGEILGTFYNDGTYRTSNIEYKAADFKDFTNAFVAAKTTQFEEDYGELKSFKDAKYDPYSSVGKRFLLTGTAELDDYYNYDYRGLEGIYFCVCITPTGGGYSDRWYIYCSRNMYNDLFETLKKGSLKMMMICSTSYPDSLKNGLAELKDYCM